MKPKSPQERSAFSLDGILLRPRVNSLFWGVIPSLLWISGILWANTLSLQGKEGGGITDRLVLVDAGQTNLPLVQILKRANAPAEESLAASELARYLELMSGVKFTVQTASSNLPARAILVGPINVEIPKDLSPDGYLIRVKGQHLHIAGGSPRGTCCGVYGFLEDHLGCRWWSWNEEDVPKRPVNDVSAGLDMVVRPPFSMHDLFNREAQAGNSNFVYKSRGTSWENFSGGHTLCPLLKPYAEKNQEFLPMNDKGKRAFNNLHMCYTAKGMPEALAEALGKQVEAHHGDTTNVVYFAGMGDWYGGMCECPQCKPIYAEETWINPDGETLPGYTATLLRMINKTAEILEKKYSGIRVGTFAYMSLEAPPAKTKPRSNVVIWAPRLRHCTVLSVLESELNKGFMHNIKRWCELAPGRVYIWEYGANYVNFLYPFPCLRSIAENIKVYHDMGVRGIMIQGNYVSTGGDLVVLKNYVWRRLMWNPNLDPDRLLAEFCKGYYGPAAEDILKYVNTLEKCVRVPQKLPLDEFADVRGSFLNPTRLDQLQQILNRASRQTKGNDVDPYYQRVQEVRASIEAAWLWHEGPLEEKDGRLVRSDLNEYTYPRAEALLKNLRGASPREWGVAKYYHMGFLTLHGGPLFTLSHGPLQIKVAPVQGQIWRILYRGQDIIKNALDSAAIGTILFNLLPSTDTNAVTMEAECGIGGWSPDTKQIIRKTVTLKADGVVKTIIMARQVNPAPDYCTNTVVVTTPYVVVANVTNVDVSTSADGNTWQKLNFDPNQTGNVFSISLKALKVTLPEQRVEVSDQYLSPKVISVKLSYDKARTNLVTTVTLDSVSIPKGQEALALDRELRVMPILKR